MKKTFVNADKVLRVHVRGIHHCTRWVWVNASPEKRRFLGLIRTPARAAGWRYAGNWEDEIYTEEYILNESSDRGAIFKRTDVLHENMFWYKARVEIESLGGKYTNADHRYFMTDQEAISYAKEIAEKFPHIEVNY